MGQNVRLAIPGVSGSGLVTAAYFTDAPRTVSGVPEANVSIYRVVAVAASGLTFSADTEVRFDADAFSGITEPTEVTVYSRPVPGTGDFAALPTTYDTDANEIVATTDTFSEFVLASNTNPLPVELSTFTATPTGEAGSGEAVTLEWTTVSETNNAGFDVERSAGGEPFTRVGSRAGRGTTTEAQRYRFVDRDLPFAGEIVYRLRQIDVDGTETVSGEVTVRLLPERVELLPSAPNPFAEAARLRYRLPEAATVRLEVFDLLGRKVATLVDGERQPGPHKAQLDGTRLAPGTYFVRLQAGSERLTQRVQVVK